MKRNINLVSYESSDEDENTSAMRAESDSSCRRKLPKVSALLTISTPVDNPALHQGRVRTTPHVDGQFAAFVYVPVPLKKNAPLRGLLEKAINHAKKIEPALVSDWIDNSSTHTLHISLSRPIYLRHYQREDLKQAVKASARTVCPFTASFSSFATFANDEHTRLFLGVEVGAGHRELETLSKAIDPILKLLHQKEFYSEPRFHASIAWALLRTSDIPSVESASRSEPSDEAKLLPQPICSFSPSFLPEMDVQYSQSLSNSKVGAFDADCICVKIGKEVFSWPLGGT